MKNEYDNAARCWDEASVINRKFGNLEQEAKLLMNYGIFHLDQLNYEKANESYLSAKSIFEHYGDKSGLGLCLLNLGEIYFVICNYGSSLKCLKQARQIFEELESENDLIEIFYLMGLVYFTFWDADSLLGVIDDSTPLVKSQNILPVQQYKIVYLKALTFFMGNQYEESIRLAETVSGNLQESFERENKILLADSYFLQVENLRRQKKYNEALLVLDNGKLAELCGKNDLVSAKREYLIASCLFAIQDSNIFLHLSKSYSLIQTLSITELSWKVISLFGEFYMDRGDKRNSKKYFIYVDEILKKIFADVEDETMINKLKSNPFVASVLDKLSY